MFIETFIEKIKSALQTQACLLCEQKLGSSSQFCGRCHEKLGIRPATPVIETAYCLGHAATILNPTVKRMLYGHKFHNRKEYIGQLAGMLIQYWESLPSYYGFTAVHPENVLVMPIPPHEGNVSLIDQFANRFARHFGYDYRHDAMTWMREVRPQHRIHDKQDRFSNIGQSLHLKSGIISGYERVIIVDDITTTGATLLEASRAFHNEVGNMSRQNDLSCLAVTKVPLGEQLRSGEAEEEPNKRLRR